MDNQPTVLKWLLKLCLNFYGVLFGVCLYFALGISLFFFNFLLGFLYFIVTGLIIRNWGKKKKAQDKTLQTTLPSWSKAGFSSENEYLADEELKSRKEEQILLLANAYKQRKNTTAFKQNLSIIDNLLNLNPVEFEKWVKTNIFEKEGWLVTETKITGDGGIDLVLNKKTEHSIAQCKRYKNTVGEPSLRDFYGTMMSEGVSRGYFVTTGLFSLPALKFADNKPIEMIDRRILSQKYF
jgi:HJR/Mrr/RecB family endonuclease